MPSAPSSNTWISFSDRPPPCTPAGSRRRCWCWFHLLDGTTKLGYLTDDGVRLMGVRRNLRLFDIATAWQPFDPETLAEFEARA